MKNTLKLVAIIGGVALIGVGCSTTNLAEVVKAASTDPAAAHIFVATPYGSITIDRANPGTNQISVSQNGITTKP